MPAGAKYELSADLAELMGSLPLSKKLEEYTGGLVVSRKLKRILSKPGYIALSGGEKPAREMHRNLNPERLSPFGFLCFMGAYHYVFRAVESGVVPPLSSTETPYQLSYATILIWGAQQFVLSRADFIQHEETLRYLLSKQLPVDIPDIVGWTALSHAAGAPRSCLELTRILIDGGANIDRTSRFRDVPLVGAFMRNNTKEVDLLLEHGADLDIADADDMTPRKFYVSAGPQITAVVRKHLLKRSGQCEAPRTDKSCDNCQKNGVSLSNCARCKVARYCSVECQRRPIFSLSRSAYSPFSPQHKTICQPFFGDTTLTVKPYYMDPSLMTLVPLAHIPRATLGGPFETVPKHHQRSSHIPKDVAHGKSKDMIIKIQASLAGKSPILVYDKKRDFVCHIRRVDSSLSYDRLDAVIREKGVLGLKPYFAAELKNENELTIKISKVLAEQPF